MAGDLQRFGDGGWSLSTPDRPRRKTAHVGRGLTTLLFIFTLLLGQASLAALAGDEPADAAATTATEEPSPSAEAPADDSGGASTDETSDGSTEDASTDGTSDTSDEVASDDGSTASETAATADASGDADAAATGDATSGSDAATAAATTDTPGPASGDGVQPVLKGGNPSCLDVMAAGDFLFERKQDPPRDATIQLSFDGLSGTLVVSVNDTNQTFGYRLTGDFVAAGVIVKGGSNANFYDYRPAGNAADTRLHAPVNPANGTFYGLSHISFCLTEVERAPGIDVEKSCPEFAQAGTEIEYTITVENTGNEELVVTVDDTLLGDITADFDVDLSAGLAVGATATAVVPYQPGPNEDPVTNTVTAEGTGDVSGETDTDTATCETDVTEGPVTRIDVEKSCPEVVQAGAEIEYTITVENTGTEALVDVSVDDTLLGDITTEFDLDLSAGLAVGATATAVVPYEPGPNEDPVTNTVTAEGTGADSAAVDTDTASCETDVTEGEVAAIAVAKSCPETVPAGGVIEYTITVENVGTEALVDITVEDSLLGDITDEFDVDLTAGLGVGGSATAVVIFRPGPEDDPVTNTVTATATGVVSADEDTATDGCETDVVTGEGPAIQIVKDGPTLAHRGDTVTYEFTVTNVGNLELFDVALTDPRCDAGTIQAGAEVDAGLANGEVWTFTCTHLITQTDPDPLPNTATIRGDTVAGAGGQEVTDQDTHTVDILQPAIRIVKTVSDSPVPVGTVVTYTYVVTNLGDTTLFDVIVDDDVLGPIDVIPSLAAGASATVTATFTVGTNPVTNVGTVAGADVLGEVVSDTDTAVVSPIAGGGGGPVPGGPEGPTVGGIGGGETPFTGFDAWDWMLLAALLGGLGALALAVTRWNRGTA
jgi:uncharacterized repeat protein (TIGR01451 family)